MITSDRDSDTYAPLHPEKLVTISVLSNDSETSNENFSDRDIEEQLMDEDDISDGDTFQKTITNVIFTLTVILLCILVFFYAIEPSLDDFEQTDNIITATNLDLDTPEKTDTTMTEQNVEDIKQTDAIKTFLESFNDVSAAPDTAEMSSEDAYKVMERFGKNNGYYQLRTPTEKRIVQIRLQEPKEESNDDSSDDNDTGYSIEVVTEDGDNGALKTVATITVNEDYFMMDGWMKKINSVDNVWHHAQFGDIQLEQVPRQKIWAVELAIGNEVEYQLQDGGWKLGKITNVFPGDIVEVDGWVRNNIREPTLNEPAETNESKFVRLQGYWKSSLNQQNEMVLFEVRQNNIISENFKGHPFKAGQIAIDHEGDYFEYGGWKQSISANDNVWYHDKEGEMIWIRVDESEFTTADSFEIDERVEYQRIIDGVWVQGNVTNLKPLEVNNWRRLKVQKLTPTYKIGELVLYTEWINNSERYHESGFRLGRVTNVLSLEVKGKYGKTIPIQIKKYEEKKQNYEPSNFMIFVVYCIWIGIWSVVCIYFHSCTPQGAGHSIHYKLLGVYVTLGIHVIIFLFFFIFELFPNCAAGNPCYYALKDAVYDFFLLPKVLLSLVGCRVQ